jgi:hypothetical protein
VEGGWGRLTASWLGEWEMGGGGSGGGVKRGGGWGAEDRGRPPPSQNLTSGRHMSPNVHRNQQFQTF